MEHWKTQECLSNNKAKNKKDENINFNRFRKKNQKASKPAATKQRSLKKTERQTTKNMCFTIQYVVNNLLLKEFPALLFFE